MALRNTVIDAREQNRGHRIVEECAALEPLSSHGIVRTHRAQIDNSQSVIEKERRVRAWRVSVKSLFKVALILGLGAGCTVLSACNDNDQLPSNGDTQGLAEVQSNEPSGTTTTEAKPVDLCADYHGFTALLAEETIRCTGTIGPKSFVIDDQGLLQNNFNSCSGGPESDRAANLESVKKLIALQNFRSALPHFQECLTDRYKRWSELFARTKLQTCPMWTIATVIGKGNKVTNRQLGKMRPHLDYVPATDKRDSKRVDDQRFVDIQVPGKSSILYNISYPQEEKECDDPAACAAQCAAFLPGFVVSAGGTQVLADPATWYSDEVFAANTCANPTTTDDPYCPPDFVHQMSVYSTSPGVTVPPGDLYGHPNRVGPGEHCLKWVSGPGGPHDYETDLRLQCIGTMCLSRCGN